MVISHNIPALMTNLHLRKNDRLMSTSMQRLSTGVKINSAKDDAAGLAIANKLTFQVSGLNKASENSTNGISLIQTAEGALNEVHNMLQRMRELAVQAANDTLTQEDRAKIQTEINELTDEITATANRTEFNKMKILNGEASRVMGSYYENEINKVISTALYVSDSVPAGKLNYTIIQPGLPAETEGVASSVYTSGQAIDPATIDNSIATANSTFSINGITIYLGTNTINAAAADYSATNVTELHTVVKNACAKSNLKCIIGDDGAITITTNGNGGQKIDIQGNNTLLNTIGMPASGTTTDTNPSRLQPAELEGVASTYVLPVAFPTAPLPAGSTITMYGEEIDIAGCNNINNVIVEMKKVFDFNFYPDGSIDLTSVTSKSGGSFNTSLGIYASNGMEDVLTGLGLGPIGISSNSTITINGQNIYISPDESKPEILQRISNLCGHIGIDLEVDPTSGAVTLTTLKEGGSERIVVSGDEDLLNLLGMTNGSAIGKGSGSIGINGVIINVKDTDSPDQVKAKIIEICSYSDIDYYQDPMTGAVHLTSKIAGSNQTVSIGGDPEFLKYFGLQPAISKGTDALINATMYDEAGNPQTAFNNGMSILSDGNQVTVTGTGAQVIKFNIQVRQSDFDALTPKNTIDITDPPDAYPKVFEASAKDYFYGDGKTAVSNMYEGDPTEMDLVIKNYGPIMLQIGPNYNMAISVQIPKLTSETLGLVEYKGGKMNRLLNYQTTESTNQAIDKIDAAISTVSTVRSKLGAYQNRLEATIRSLDTTAENTEISRSRIQDTDMAAEMTAYTQRNVMYQAGLAILGQANQRPMQVLQLLQ